MKKTLALVAAAVLLVMVIVPAAAYSTPAELTSLFDIGVWGTLNPGVDCDPGLADTGIKDGAHVYGLFDSAYAPLSPPSSVGGYTKVDNAADMTDGTWCVHDATSGFQYVLVMGEPTAAEESPTPTVEESPSPTPTPAESPSPTPTPTQAEESPSPEASETPEEQGITVYFSVSVRGTLLVAAQPVIATGTVEDAIKEAHKSYYSGGESGFSAGVDRTYNMYLISRFWGVNGTPYVMVNGLPLGQDSSKPSTAEDYTIENGMNISIVVQDGMEIPVVGLTNTDGELTATKWTLNMSTFSYSSEPFSESEVIDAETGDVLGETDASGKFTLSTVPECGVAAIGGVTAVPVGEVKTFDSNSKYEIVNEQTAGNYVDVTIAFPELQDLTIALKNAYNKYAYGPFVFNDAQNAYSIYLGTGGTVTFSKDTTLSYVDAATYQTTTKTFSAGEAASVNEVNGGALYFTGQNGDFATFMLDTDPTYAAGVSGATFNIDTLAVDAATPSPGSEKGGINPTVVIVIIVVVVILIAIIALNVASKKKIKK